MTSTNINLLHRSLHTLNWNYLGLLVRFGTQLILGIVLVRFLGLVVWMLLANEFVSAYYSDFTTQIDLSQSMFEVYFKVVWPLAFK